MSLREARIICGKFQEDAAFIERNAESKETETLARLERLTVQVGDRVRKAREELDKIEGCFERELANVKGILADERKKANNQAARLRNRATDLSNKIEQLAEAHERAIKAAVKKAEEKAKNAPQENPAFLGTSPLGKADPRAATLAIYDSIIFAISNWSTEGDSAPDFELACQATLFPTIYERVMKGEDDYYMEEVPSSAMEVVKRGREYVKMLRETQNASLVDSAVWSEFQPMIHEWWINDALPLLYGARAEEWDTDKPYSLLEVQSWKQQPASRALHFPLIFDGMELVEKHRDQIRETSGLPDFNKQTLQTRLQP